MKKFNKSIFGLIVGVMLFTSCEKEESLQQNSSNNINAEITNVEPDYAQARLFSIEVEIVFGHNEVFLEDGAWVVAECVGFGICDISVSHSFPDASGEIVFSDGNLVLKFKESDLSEEIINEYFQGTVMSFDEDLVLSDEICSSLDLPMGYTVLKGDYTLVNELGEFLIKLN